MITLLPLVASFALVHPSQVAEPELEPTAERVDVIDVAIAEVSPARLIANVEHLVAFGTRHTASETESDTRGIGAARRWLESELRAVSAACDDRLQVRTQAFMQELVIDAQGATQEVELVNVYGFLPGTVGDRTYVISGHYDSINGDRYDAEGDAPGANDDASGTSVVLESARVLSHFEFDANLVFLCVPGEEQGLLGSFHFASQLASEGLSVTAMFTNDIVGGAHGPGFEHDHSQVRVFSGGDATDSGARELSRLVAETARVHVPNFGVRQVHQLDRNRRGGDHIPFHKLEIPAVRFTEAREDYRRQHKHVAPDKSTGDLLEFISADYMAQVARVNVAALARLASAPATPQRFRVFGAMSHTTELSWDEVPGAVAYEVLRRETTANDWQHVHHVEATELDLEATIDNYYWGVRAVSASGHSGMPATGPRQ
jgi:hypothetical protein